MSAFCFIHQAGLLPLAGRMPVDKWGSTAHTALRYRAARQQQPLKFFSTSETGLNTSHDYQIFSKTTMADTEEKSLGTKIGAGIVVVGLLVGTFLPLARIIQNSATDSDSTVLNSQLSKVPIFTITDATGRPYMSETEDRRLRRGYFFVQPADAQKYLEQISQDNTDAKVLIISLNEAFKFLDNRPTAAKSVPERFELFPDDHQLEVAQDVTNGAFEQVFGKYSVPIFYIDGLGIKEGKNGSTVYPLFFEKEKLDETVSNLKKADPSATIDLKDVQVIDLKQTIKEIKAGANPKLNNVVFVPLTESLAKLNSS